LGSTRHPHSPHWAIFATVVRCGQLRHASRRRRNTSAGTHTTSERTIFAAPAAAFLQSLQSNQSKWATPLLPPRLFIQGLPPSPAGSDYLFAGHNPASGARVGCMGGLPVCR
jgi:hypothetical protein